MVTSLASAQSQRVAGLSPDTTADPAYHSSHANRKVWEALFSKSSL